MHRFFAPSLDPGDEAVTLPRDEGEHLTRVLRLGVGDTVSIFDGRGHEFSARIVSVERRDVRVQLVSRIEPAAEPTVALTLAQAVIKGDKMDDIIRDAVMLGVAAVQPLVTSRTESTVAQLTNGNRLDRWRRVALASVKQSKRAVLPDVRRPLTLEAFLARKPVITCHDSGGPNEFVIDGVNGRSIEPSAEALADAINNIAADRRRAARLGDAGHMRAQEITWDGVIEKLVP